MLRTGSSLITRVAVTVLLGGPVVAGGQTTRKLVITPYAGVFAPTTRLAELAAAGGGVRVHANLKQKAAFALGGNASYWLSERTAIEVGGAYAFSDAKGSFTFVEQGDRFSASAADDAYAVMGSAKLMVSLLPQTSPMSLRFGVGPAIVHRGGDAYKADADGKITGLTDVGGAISLCTKIPITKSLALRLRGENFMYSAKLGFEDPVDPSNNFKFDSKFQNDLLFSAGLQFGFDW